jgi:hypothetical protein
MVLMTAGRATLPLKGAVMIAVILKAYWRQLAGAAVAVAGGLCCRCLERARR